MKKIVYLIAAITIVGLGLLLVPAKWGDYVPLLQLVGALLLVIGVLGFGLWLFVALFWVLEMLTSAYILPKWQVFATFILLAVPAAWLLLPGHGLVDQTTEIPNETGGYEPFSLFVGISIAALYFVHRSYQRSLDRQQVPRALVLAYTLRKNQKNIKKHAADTRRQYSFTKVAMELPGADRKTLERQFSDSLKAYGDFVNARLPTTAPHINEVLATNILATRVLLESQNKEYKLKINNVSLEAYALIDAVGPQFALLFQSDFAESISDLGQRSSSKYVRTPVLIQGTLRGEIFEIEKFEPQLSYIERQLLRPQMQMYAQKHGYIYRPTWARFFLPKDGIMSQAYLLDRWSVCSNLVFGSRDGVPFSLLTYKPYLMHQKDQYAIGTVLLPKSYKHFLIVRKNDYTMRLSAAAGLEGYDTESNLFNEKYHVFGEGSQSMRDALELLNPAIMQRLIETPYDVSIEVVGNTLNCYVREKKLSETMTQKLYEFMLMAFDEMKK